MVDAEVPTVSVIVPCYNQAQFLGEALESVLSQAFAGVELIIVNDGSQDATRTVAQSYLAAHSCICYHEQANAGLAAARNRGLALSRGAFIVFLDADDKLLPGALELGAALLEENPECAFVAGAHRDIAQDGRPLGDAKGPQPKADPYAAMLCKNDIGMIAAAVFRREVLAALGGFDSSLAACEDYDLYLNLVRKDKVCYHPHPVAAYRRHAHGMSRDAGLILQHALKVQARQWPHVRHTPPLRTTYFEGRRQLRDYYGRALTGQLRQRWQQRRFRFFLDGVVKLGRYAPLVGARELARFLRRIPGGSTP